MSEDIDARPLNEPFDGIPPITHDDVATAVATLAQSPGKVFALDTERAMGIRYSDRAYLVQVKSENSPIYLIDPVGVEDKLGPLADALSGEWILHSADQDLPSLRELGLEPTKVFDTEMAALLLGYDHTSLQHLVADLLGWYLAKEHSNADWSERPLGPDLRAYAALDVQLLHELRDSLTEMLKNAGRFDWFEQECEEIRMRPPKPPKAQPWRRAARQAGVKDQRALAMIEQLWKVRDEIAKSRDLNPSKVFPTKLVGELASHKLRSYADLKRSPLLRRRERQKLVAPFWEAIDAAWHTPESELPARKFRDPNRDPFPPTNRWDSVNPEAGRRWHAIRDRIFSLADELGIRQDVLLKPIVQKTVAWNGWSSTSDLHRALTAAGARPWQIELTVPVLAQTA
ncbi:ribonuclease D [Arcanobacterium wilhelmae]|uniref:Ribonuclease D n=1 Tax=Arcanobacterium wilhelmae TaxID=1803177 RepID=A0ABT9N8W8_9ACTO|nr:HRDC domain-containing protein [Arcanobacterium wilhelmae]MDP9800147.1 ribonuclease D [Arcanobacterium wilhelmae]WFN89587.1 HRDC domain-containing protein [Arcanobacterium wilhelmae]